MLAGPPGYVRGGPGKPYGLLSPQGGFLGGVVSPIGASAFPPDVSHLLGWYKFNEGSGTNVVDYSGSGNNGTVGSGGVLGPYGLTPGGSAGYMDTVINWSAIKTLVVTITPQQILATTPVTIADSKQASDHTATCAFAGSMTEGQLFPRAFNVTNATQCNADYNVAQWPVVFGVQDFTGTPTLWLDGVAALVYTNQQTSTVAGQLRLGGNSQGTPQLCILHYALVYSTILTAPQMLAAANFCKAQIAGRNIPASGPVVLTRPLVTYSGNSITNNIPLPLDLKQLTSQIRSAINGATPQQVAQQVVQALVPLKRPLAPGNVGVVWPTPNGIAADSIANAVSSGDALRAAGIRAVLVSAISAVTYDATKNTVNAAYADPTTGWVAHYDGFADLAPQVNVSADNAYSNLTYYNADQVHPLTPGTYNTEIDPVLIPAIAAQLPPAAFFTPSVLAVVNGGSITFTDSSLGTITSRAWDFGDGGTSTATSPTHQFNINGDYGVRLTVTGPRGSTTYQVPITVGPEATILTFSPFVDIKAGNLWNFKADGTNAVTGDSVSTFFDCSGNTNSPSQATALLMPSLQSVSGSPVLRFHQQVGNKIVWASGIFAAALAAGAEIFTVERVIIDGGDATSNGHWQFGSSGSGDFYGFGGQTSVFEGFGSTTRHGGYTVPALTSFHLYHVASVAGSFTVDVDQVNKGSDATNTVGWTSTPNYGVSVGAQNSSRELQRLIVTPPLSGADRTTLSNILKTRYGTP